MAEQGHCDHTEAVNLSVIKLDLTSCHAQANKQTKTVNQNLFLSNSYVLQTGNIFSRAAHVVWSLFILL